YRAIRSSNSMTAAIRAISSTVRVAVMAWVSQSSRARRPVRYCSLALSVMLRMVLRPSLGSRERVISPAVSSAATMVAIDCGRIPPRVRACSFAWGDVPAHQRPSPAIGIARPTRTLVRLRSEEARETLQQGSCGRQRGDLLRSERLTECGGYAVGDCMAP